MRCDAVLPLLSDFADRSLSPLAALRVRRHLRACASCQTAWADTQTFDQQARALYADKIALPSGLRTRVLSAAPVPAVRPVSRRRSLTQIAVAGVCVAACFFAVAALVRFSPPSARPAVAFAQVEAAMQTVQTVHWVEKSRTRMGINGPWRTDYIRQKWARLDTAPALMETYLPGGTLSDAVVLTTPEQTVLRKRVNGQVAYTVTDNTPLNRLFKGTPETRARNWFASQSLAPVNRGAARSSKGKRSPWDTPWTSKTVTENGKSLLLFSRAFSMNDGYPEGTFPGRAVPGQAHRVWVEPRTNRVVRRESLYLPDGKNVETEVTADQFLYNETPPPSIFVLTVPPGASVKREKWEVAHIRPASPHVWNKLNASEKQKIQAAVDRSDAGWRDVNFDRFASAWDMNYIHVVNPKSQTEAARKKQWQTRLNFQKGKWTNWRSTIVDAYEERELFRLDLPSADPPVLRLMVIITGRANIDGKPGKPWRAPGTFVVRRLPGGDYKIVDWQNSEALGAGWGTVPELRAKYGY